MDSMLHWHGTGGSSLFPAVALSHWCFSRRNGTGQRHLRPDWSSGVVNAVGFSADGKIVFAAAGEPGMFGEVRLFNVWTAH